jgi:hypothetical protein
MTVVDRALNPAPTQWEWFIDGRPPTVSLATPDINQGLGGITLSFATEAKERDCVLEYTWSWDGTRARQAAGAAAAGCTNGATMSSTLPARVPITTPMLDADALTSGSHAVHVSIGGDAVGCPDGEYTVTVTATDPAGNVGNVTKSVESTGRTVTPSTVAAVPSSSPSFAAVSVTWTVPAADAALQTYTVEVVATADRDSTSPDVLRGFVDAGAAKTLTLNASAPSPPRPCRDQLRASALLPLPGRRLSFRVRGLTRRCPVGPHAVVGCGGGDAASTDALHGHAHRRRGDRDRDRAHGAGVVARCGGTGNATLLSLAHTARDSCTWRVYGD